MAANLLQGLLDTLRRLTSVGNAQQSYINILDIAELDVLRGLTSVNNTQSYSNLLDTH
jgi:glutaredoxin 2